MPDSAIPVTNPRSRVTFQLPKTTQKLDVDMGVEGVEEDSDEGKANIRTGFNMAVRVSLTKISRTISHMKIILHM